MVVKKGLSIFVFFLVFPFICYSAIITDSFDVSHDYLTDVVSGTVWDGIVYNDGVAATQDTVVTAAAATGGGLNLQSRNGNWEHADDDGLLLYIDVPAGQDFVADVYISDYTWLNYHDVGLMARAADASAVDYVMNRYFPQWGVDNAMRSTDGGVSSGTNGTGDPAMPYIQLEKNGPLFTVRASSDGITYTPVGSVSRWDMIGVPLQVGLYQATFSGNTGDVTFDDFSIDIYPEDSIDEKTIYWPNQFNDYPEVTAERSAESDNFVIYWGEKCGLDPTAASDPALRFSPSDALTMLESFYDTYIDSLGFLDDSTGNISTYKFIVVMNETWNNAPWTGWAFGGHYDGVIGAMWVHPGACNVPSTTLAHEFAHSLQNQAWIENPGYGLIGYEPVGFFWESHANFMMLQHYTYLWEAIDLVRFLNTQHFHFSSVRHHYTNSLFLQYIEDKRGIEMINRLWRESIHQEHPLQTYMRLTGMIQSQLNDEFGEYAMKNVNFDYSVGAEIRHTYDNETNHHFLGRRFTMLEPMSGQANAYKVPYYMAPQDYGYNVVQLNPDSPTATVNLNFYGQPNSPAGGAEYRFGFVAVDGSTSRHSQLYSVAGGAEVPASFTMQANETELYLVVLGAPAVHHNYYWEEGWPKYYRYPWQIQITGATPFVDNHKNVTGSYHANGGGFVANTATVASTVYVGPDACVLGNANLQGNVRLEDMASVTDGVVASGDAILRHGVWAGWTTIQSSAQLEETCMQIGGTVSGTYIGGGDQEGNGDCSSGYYRQVPHSNNGRTACDGLTIHAANDDINPIFTDYVFQNNITPNPAQFHDNPYPMSNTSVKMTAVTGQGDGSIEYYFSEISGNPGGDDSDWQDNPQYIDDGLTAGQTYAYTVKIRNGTGLETSESDPIDVTLAFSPDIDGNEMVNNQDLIDLMFNWLHMDCSYDNFWCDETDFDISGDVNLNDFSLLAGFWLSDPAAGSEPEEITSISVNFDRDATSTPPMGTSDIAGQYQIAGWNDINSAAAGGFLSPVQTFHDNNMVPTTLTVSVSNGSADSWNTMGTPDERLYGDWLFAGSGTTISLSSIPYLRYDLYVYHSHYAADEIVDYSVGPVTKQLSNTVGNPYSQTPTHIENVTYVLFSGLTESDIDVVVSTVSGQTGIAGFQIVKCPNIVH